MHFADELVEQSGFDFPALNEKVADAEKKVAKMLIDTMSVDEFDPEQFHDKYKEDVLAMIEARANGEEIEKPEMQRPAATNVVNLMDVLQRSLEQSKARRRKGGARGRRRRGRRSQSPPSARRAAHKKSAGRCQAEAQEVGGMMRLRSAGMIAALSPLIPLAAPASDADDALKLAARIASSERQSRRVTLRAAPPDCRPRSLCRRRRCSEGVAQQPPAHDRRRPRAITSSARRRRRSTTSGRTRRGRGRVRRSAAAARAGSSAPDSGRSVAAGRFAMRRFRNDSGAAPRRPAVVIGVHIRRRPHRHRRQRQRPARRARSGAREDDGFSSQLPRSPLPTLTAELRRDDRARGARRATAGRPAARIDVVAGRPARSSTASRSSWPRAGWTPSPATRQRRSSRRGLHEDGRRHAVRRAAVASTRSTRRIIRALGRQREVAANGDRSPLRLTVRVSAAWCALLRR